MKRTSLSVFAAAAFIAAGASAIEAKTRVGILTCNIEGGPGFIVGSTKEARCLFNPNGSGGNERYTGSINRVGIDIGVTGNAVMTWAVFAPSDSVKRRALAGNYVGASAEASAGVGGGANLLVGGNDNTISLQPLSVKGQTGVNAALGIASLELR
jgi:hypothetical protein